MPSKNRSKKSKKSSADVQPHDKVVAVQSDAPSVVVGDDEEDLLPVLSPAKNKKRKPKKKNKPSAVSTPEQIVSSNAEATATVTAPTHANGTVQVLNGLAAPSTADTFHMNGGTVHHPDHPSRPSSSRRCALLRTLVYVALFISGLCVAAAYCVHQIHDEFFVTILDRAERTDDDLAEEFTYYDRQCTMLDITASKQTVNQELYYTDEDHAAIYSKSSRGTEMSADRPKGWEIMMRHGGVIMPNILSPETVRGLREFVIRKNEAVRGTPDEYPVSQGFNRISYGIDATEDPIVVRALKEIRSQPRLQKILPDLVGPNPALSEITAMTSTFGAPHQVWHPDTKPDGNSLRFARTYMHSYTLFIPLQNTTKDMGATDVCPGTQYCSDDLETVCENHGFSMGEQEGGWKAGDGALLNQHVWHRGGEHYGEDTLERVLFSVTFLGRPTAKDPRQLARGTYFHMKWNMWGHTWNDLKDCDVSMAWPFSVLRCLHLWKPADRQWGFDLFTSAALRIANRQSGCHPEDLPVLMDILDRIGFPSFLDGTADEESEDAWPVYISETIQNVYEFACDVFCMLALIHFVLSMALPPTSSPTERDTPSGRTRRLGGFMYKMLVVLIISFTFATYFMSVVRNTPWSQDIASGTTLMRPFASVESGDLDAVDDSNSELSGPTTLPRNTDILVGSRYTKDMGAYSYWLDYHPGNYDFGKIIKQYGGGLFRSYREGLPPAFSQHIEEIAAASVTQAGGRFLAQDYRTGVWRVMSEEKIMQYVHKSLVVGRRGAVFEVQKELDFQLSDYRVGWLRKTKMAGMAEQYIEAMSYRLIAGAEPVRSAQNIRQNETTRGALSPSFLLLVAGYRVPSPGSERASFKSRTARVPRLPTGTMSPSSIATQKQALHRGAVIRFRYDDGPDDTIPATIVSVDDSGNEVSIAYAGNDAYDFGSFDENIPVWSVEELPPLTDGMDVEVLSEDDEWIPAVVSTVYPDGTIDAVHTDGSVGQDIDPDRYRY